MSNIANYVDYKELALMPSTTKRQREVLEAVVAEGSQVKAALALGTDRRNVDRIVRTAYNRAVERGYVYVETEENEQSTTLVLDIETAPLRSFLWSLWPKGGISPSFLTKDTYILGYAYHWLGDDEDATFARTINQTPEYADNPEDDSGLLRELWHLFNRAEVIIAHNGDKFDIKRIKTRMVVNGLKPPLPFRTVDTLKICKREFNFTSNKLDFVAQTLLGIGKLDTGGFDLWVQCLEGNEEAFEHMRDYNAMDVEILTKVYYKLRAWDRSHPTMNHGTSDMDCKVCGGELELVTSQTAKTNVSEFELYTCKDCGHHQRGSTNVRNALSKSRRTVSAR